MIAAQPGATFTAIAEGFASGLTGTLGVRIENTDATTHTARATAGIVELEAGSGVYAKANLIAPTVPGDYVLVWDASGLYATEELQVGATIQSIDALLSTGRGTYTGP